jgi:starvation-inducible outer membrane lipoprotein
MLSAMKLAFAIAVFALALSGCVTPGKQVSARDLKPFSDDRCRQSPNSQDTVDCRLASARQQ